jgi:predicted MFS family arabinose efflux permease
MSSKTLNLRVGLLTLSRLLVNTPVRMVYPFLAVFAANLGVEVSRVSFALAISMATSAAGPFLAPIADRRGRKTGMLIGMGIFLAGTLTASLFPGYLSFLFAVLLGNLANNILIPALQAYIGDHTSYARRGLYLAITELSWALSFILLVPVAGAIIEKTNWQGPYFALTLLGIIMTLVLWKVIPNDRPANQEPLTIFKDIGKVLSYPPAWIGILMGTSFILGNELVQVMFGVWMQDAFGLQIAALAAASVVIGISELAGEGLVAALADRLGKERTIGLSIAINAVWVLALFWLGGSRAGAFVWLFVFFLTFEVGIVSSLPLMSEVTPAARATMMSLFIAALSLGRALGDLAAPLLYKNGFIVNALVCLGLDVLALFALSRIKLSKEKTA